jgi:hypothetical protein
MDHCDGDERQVFFAVSSRVLVAGMVFGGRNDPYQLGPVIILI